MSFPKRAMVLAAGLGTRLRPLTRDRPKALVEVGGRPMIEYTLRMLAAAGTEEVVINVHHRGEKVRAALGDGAAYGLRLRYSPEERLLDTGGGILKARARLEPGAFVVANCDALLDLDLGAVWERHQRKSAVATLVLRADSDAERYGPVDVDAEGRIRRFLGKPEKVPEPLERRMFCGVHILSPAIFELMPPGGAFSITRDTYVQAVAAGAALYGFEHRGYWRDLGTTEGVAAATADLSSGRFPSLTHHVMGR